MPPKITVNVSSDENNMIVGELLHAAQRKCDEPEAASAKEAREVVDDPMVEAALRNEDIASRKKPSDEEVQA